MLNHMETREIKFRAWDESEKQMVEWPHLKNDPDEYLIGLLRGESPEDTLKSKLDLKV